MAPTDNAKQSAALMCAYIHPHFLMRWSPVHVKKICSPKCRCAPRKIVHQSGDRPVKWKQSTVEHRRRRRSWLWYPVRCQRKCRVQKHIFLLHTFSLAHTKKNITPLYIKQTKAERSTCFSLGVHSCLGIVRSPQNRRVRWNIPE